MQTVLQNLRFLQPVLESTITTSCELEIFKPERCMKYYQSRYEVLVLEYVYCTTVPVLAYPQTVCYSEYIWTVTTYQVLVQYCKKFSDGDCYSTVH